MEEGDTHRPGLCEYLSFLAADLDELCQPSTLPSVDLISRGSGGALPDLLGSNRFRELVTAASQRYSVIIIEAPAVLDYADAALIRPLCTRVLLVVRGKTASSATMQRAIDDVGRDAIAGLVMTDLHRLFLGRDV